MCSIKDNYATYLSEKFMKVIALIIFAIGSALGQSSLTDSISYKIKPVPKVDRTDLEIAVKFKATKTAPSKIKLLTGCYGTPKIYKYISSLKGKNGTTITKSEKETERILTPNKSGDVSIKYVISFDPKELENSAFAPKISQNHFSVAGCQWLLHFGNDNEKRDVSIEIIGAPKEWKLHSSISKNAKKIKLRARYRDLLPTRIGGGGDFHTFFIKNKPVSVFIKGNFDIPNQKIFDAAEKIVRSQRDWFEDYEQPFYNIVINERKGVVAGTAVKNQFVCFVRSGVDETALNMILAHELFHNWLPIKMAIKRDKGEGQIRHEWFFEGFTEYFAKKVLFDAGLLTPRQFADLINKDIHSLADNPHKSILYKELLKIANARKFTSSHKKLSYYRGVLIALKWENALQKSDKNLSGFIRSLYKYASSKNGEITENEFNAFAKSFGIDAKGDFEKYILEGRSIEVDPNSLGEKFTANEKDVPLFEMSFDIIESRKQKKISGVIKNGVAYKAGLRNGMNYIRAKNSSRFSNAWSPEKPVTIVANINGKEKVLEYFPRGEVIKLMHFNPK